MNEKYKALQIDFKNNKYQANIVNLTIPKLQNGQLLIKILYSSLNYKDCLSISGHRGITRNYPHIPGVDLAGVIIESKDNNFSEGEEIIATGYDIGMNHPGGFAEFVVLNSELVIKKPKNLSLRQAMLFGTAGFAAALSVNYIEKFIDDISDKKILVTGAKGGVGLISLLLLKNKADNLLVSSRGNDQDFFNKIGLENINFVNFSDDLKNTKPLLDKNFDIVIDNLGGEILESIIKQVNYNGIICSCGNILGNNLASSLFPFILRGIRLQGISSANCNMKIRKEIWSDISLFKDWENLESVVKEISLFEVKDKSQLMLQGKSEGRFIVRLDV